MKLDIKDRTIMAIREALKGSSLEPFCYLVGGSVRDLLLGRLISDYDLCVEVPGGDIALAGHLHSLGLCTRPQKFRKHGLITCKIGDHSLEISQTLKQHKRGDVGSEQQFGTLQEDAMSRDFTINSLYIRLSDMTLLDPCARGLQDIASRKIVSVKEPEQCVGDDPLRILRAIRFAPELDFTIDQSLFATIKLRSSMLCGIPVERVSDEMAKMFRFSPNQALQLLMDSGALQAFSPQLDSALKRFLDAGESLTNIFTDSGKPAETIRIYTALLWIIFENRKTALDSIRNSTGADSFIETGLLELERCFVIKLKDRTLLKNLGLAYTYLLSRPPTHRDNLPDLHYISDLLGGGTRHLLIILDLELRFGKSGPECIREIIAGLIAAERSMKASGFNLNGNDLLPLLSRKDQPCMGLILLLLKLRWMQKTPTPGNTLSGLLQELMANEGFKEALLRLKSAPGKIHLLWEITRWKYLGLI